LRSLFENRQTPYTIMAKKVKTNLRELGDADLKALLQEEQTRVKQHAFNHVITPLENPMQIRASRREVARIMTELNKRKATAQAQ
jgi:large subunit ribosomal protein L29